MEVILNSDIARLVLGYLQNQNLQKAANVFIQMSPYLEEENRLMKKGYRSVNLGAGSLLDIVREFCEIKSIVAEFIASLPEELNDEFSNQCSVLSKIKHLLKISKRNFLKDQLKTENKILKRRRMHSSGDTVETTKIQDLPGYSPSLSKRRRLSNSYLVLKTNKIGSDDSSNDTTSTNSSSDYHNTDDLGNLNDSSLNPRQEDNKFEVPSFPEISEAILENNEFQSKLVKNINKALQTSLLESAEKKVDGVSQDQTEDTPNDQLTLQLEEIVKKILDETEKEPTFDKVIENALYTKVNEPRHNRSDKNNPAELIQSTSVVGTQNPKAPDNSNAVKVIDDTQKSVDQTTNIVDSSNLTVSKLIVINSNENSVANSPLTGDPLLADNSQNLNNQIFTPFSEQVYIDMSTGQMSIPLYMANDNLPLYISNDLMQQLQHDGFKIETAKLDFSEKADINLPDAEEVASKPALVEKNIKSSSTSPAFAKQFPVSLNSRIARDKETPSDCTTDLNTSRSLSTPRRRASHVRVLDFASPLKIRTNLLTQPIENPIRIEVNAGKWEQVNEVKCNSTNEVSGTIALNEGSSSSSVHFAYNKSNETVIHANISETPKRKTEEQTCIKKLSKSSEDDYPLSLRKDKVKSEDETKAKQITKNPGKIRKTSRRRNVCTLKEDNVKEKVPCDSMEEWKQMRSIQSNQWDQHLRELVSKTTPIKTKRRRANRKNTSKSKKSKRLKKLNDNSSLVSNEVSAKNEPEKALKGKTSECSNVVESNKKKPLKKHLINFKIPTPVKKTKDDSLSKHFEKEGENVLRRKKEISDIVNKTNTEKPDNKQEKLNESKKNTVRRTKDLSGESVDLPSGEQSATVPTKEKEKRIRNISHVLETPYKVDITNFPITPRFLAPQAQDTPITKMMNSFRDQISSHKNPDVPTPQFAITPGSGFTPNEKETPRSGHKSSCPTDYSSGGSYYKPDESEDLDKHFDAILTCERLRERNEEETRSKNNYSDDESLENELSAGETVETVICAVTEGPCKPSSKAEILEGNVILKDINNSLNSSDIWLNRNKSNDSMSLSDITSSEDETEVQANVENKRREKETLMGKEENRIKPRISEVTKTLAERSRNLPAQMRLSENNCIKLAELEEKRLRMKEKLKGDFSPRTSGRSLIRFIRGNKTIVTKKIVANPNIKNIVKRPNVTKINPIRLQVVPDADIPINQMDMLKALNLSAKKVPIPINTQVPVAKVIQSTSERKSLLSEVNDNAVLDTFEEEDFPKLHVEEDSQESKTSNDKSAPLTVTTFQKCLEEKTDSLEFDQSKHKETPKPQSSNKKKPARISVKKCKNDRKMSIRRVRRPTPVKISPRRKELERPITRNMSVSQAGNKFEKPTLRTSKILSQPLPVVRELDFARRRNRKKSGGLEKTLANEITKANKIDKSENQADLNSKQTLKRKLLTDQEESNVSKIKEVKVVLENIGEKYKMTKNTTSQNSSAEAIMQYAILKDVDEKCLTQIAEIRSSADELKSHTDVQNANHKKDKPNITDSEQEDEDTYDVCQMVSIDETDHRYFHIVHEENGDDPPSFSRMAPDELLASVMNIFLDDEPHVFKVADEVLLFANDPKDNICNRPIQKIPRKRERIQNKKENYFDPQRNSTPKFNLRYRNRFNPEQFTGVGSSSEQKANVQLDGTEDDGVSSSTSVSKTSLPNTNAESQSKVLKSEDIFAVLSHLHGNDEI